MLINEALASAEPAMSGQPVGIANFLPLILVGVVFFFLVIRPQQKKVKAHQEMTGDLKKGDRVMTGGGLFGKVVKVEETEVVLEIAKDVKVTVLKNAIADKIVDTPVNDNK